MAFSMSLLTPLFNYLWARCSPAEADDPEILSRLLPLEQRLDKLDEKALQQKNVAEQPIALLEAICATSAFLHPGHFVTLGDTDQNRSTTWTEYSPVSNFGSRFPFQPTETP